MNFRSYLNSSIKMKNPDAFLLAEVYNPNEYRNYIRLGKMDYLYDKVETYDKLKEIIQGKSTPDGLSDIQNRMADIEHHNVAFLGQSRRTTFGKSRICWNTAKRQTLDGGFHNNKFFSNDGLFWAGSGRSWETKTPVSEHVPELRFLII